MMGGIHENFRLLIKEIDKILSAPYAVLLTPLQHILNKVDDTEVFLWTVAKACQVAPLVGCLIRRLDKDQSAWSALLCLIANDSVRDEVIKQNPGILQRLFSSVDENNVYEACIKLCSRPFPEDFAPPPEYTPFVSSVLRNARDESHSTWSDKAHSLFVGITPAILLTLDDDIIDECASIWGDALQTNDNVSWIKTMYIAAFVHRNLFENKSSPTCSMGTFSDPISLLTWAKKCSTLFSSERAQKVIRSVTLRALYVISERSALSIADAVDCLDTVRQILGAFDAENLRVAMLDQDFLQIVTKLSQKAAQDNLPLTVRLSAFSILMMLDTSCKYWDVHALQLAFRQFLHDQLRFERYRDVGSRLRLKDNFAFQHNHLDLLQSLAIVCLSQASLLQECLDYVIDWCRPGTHATIDTLSHLYSAQMFMNIISHLGAEAELSIDVARCIVTTDLPDWWNWERGRSAHLINCRALEVCPHARLIIRQRLAKDISDTVIMSACTFGLQMNSTTYQTLRETMDRGRSESDASKHCCTWSMCAAHIGYAKEHTNIFPSDQSQSNKGVNLIELLAAMNDDVVQSVNQYVDEICRDLQLRCQRIEEPLMMERAKCDGLNKQLTETQSSMEVLLADHRARTLSWQHDLDVAQQQTQVLEGQRAKVEMDLQLMREELENEAQKARSSETTNMELRQQHQALHEELEVERSVTSQFKDDLAVASSENERLRAQLEELQGKEQRLLCVLRGGQVIP